METAALGFIRGGSSRHILISTKPISKRLGEIVEDAGDFSRIYPCQRLKRCSTRDSASLPVHALPRVGYPPRDRHDFDPEVLGQVKRGHRDGAQEGVGYC